MRVPPGVSHQTPAGEPRVCKLYRSLYGLRQAGREWAITLSNFILKWGFTRFAIDVCLFIYASDSSILWLLVYVDDILTCDNCTNLPARFVDALSHRFPVEDKGELKWILNFAVTSDRVSRHLIMLSHPGSVPGYSSQLALLAQRAVLRIPLRSSFQSSERPAVLRRGVISHRTRTHSRPRPRQSRGAGRLLVLSLVFGWSLCCVRAARRRRNPPHLAVRRSTMSPSSSVIPGN